MSKSQYLRKKGIKNGVILIIGNEIIIEADLSFPENLG